MTVYVAEINGRAIAALDADDHSAAEEWFKGEEFLGDVCSSFEDEENRPLWDGSSEIHVRQAAREEAEEWGKSYAKAISQNEINEDDEWLVFLIPVIDATDDEEAEEEKDAAS